MTHSPEVVNQFLTLNLVAPATTADIGDALDKLVACKTQYEQEQATSCVSSEAASDAGISATESLICEMSRQVSKTESSEENVGAEGSSAGDDQVDLLSYTGVEETADSCADGKSALVQENERGAVGGAEVWGSQDGTGQNSDSTVEGDSGSVESQASVYNAGRQESSDSIGGAVGGEPGPSTPADSGSRKPTRPALLYSQMLNMPRPESALRSGGQKSVAGSPLSPWVPKHPPLTPSSSSPANLYPVSSPREKAQSAGPHSSSLDSASSRQAGHKMRDSGGQGNKLNVGGKEASAIHRRSTFRRDPPKGQVKSKTAVERRETFSGHRKKYNAQAGEALPSGQVKKDNANPWRGHEAPVARGSALPNRPRDLFYSGNPSSSMPPLSASWSGVASGLFKNASLGTAGASYSSVASTPITPSPSCPSPRGLHSGEPPAQPSQLSPSGHQHRLVSARVSAPSLREMQVQQKVPLAARPSLPHSSQFSLSPSQSIGQHMGDSQIFLPSPMGSPSGPSGLADIEQEFPPLSLSASMSSLPRRNSSNSSFSARSGNSTAATAAINQPRDQQPSSLDNQHLRQLQTQTRKSGESQETNADSCMSLKKSSTHTGPSCDMQSVESLALATGGSGQEVTLLADQNVGGLVTAVSRPPDKIQQETESGSEMVSGAVLLPTDKAFTARWIADLSPPSTADVASQPEAPGEWTESTHL
ncbi:hypothetical protein ElyMa_006667400 [Elysia marginata]|uniref:Uncharacterized protein n=1 Tax=Elysia marginata TaxID=1093978 RepID=A0AAV4ILZ4_9GAST|nr:hypothetical protein ElyMa_006667400 [Elysia marginata]